MKNLQDWRFVVGQLRVGLGAIRRSGFLRSLFTGRPVDGDGAPIPWLTYSAMHQLDAALRPDDTVLEFGSGHSTLWFSRRVRSVTSIETDAGWAEEVKQLLAAEAIANVRVVHTMTFDEQVSRKMISDASVVVVDGAWRIEVTRLLSSDPSCQVRLVVLDNTDVEPWSTLPQSFAEEGSLICRHRSLGPCLLHEWETTLVYRGRADRQST